MVGYILSVSKILKLLVFVKSKVIMEKDNIKNKAVNDKISIAILAPAKSVHTQRWANSLSDEMNVTVISLESHRAESRLYKNDVTLFYLPSSGKISYFLAHKALREYCNSRKFDVYNAHYASGYGRLLRKAKLSPSILSVWGSDIYEFPHRSALHKLILKKNLKYPNVITSSSFNMTIEIERLYNIESSSIPVIPFGVDLQAFPMISKRQIINKVILGTCKSIEEIYGIDDMIESYRIAKKRLYEELNLDSELHIYGDGSLRKKLEEKVVDLNISSSVIFHGWITHNQIPDAIRKMDIYLLSSHQESFGVSAIEAMAAGVPLIATSTVGFTEVVKDGVTGILVPVAGVHEMSNEIVNLVSNPHLRASLVAGGRKRVEELYDWDKNVRSMIDLINDLLDRRNE